MSKVSFSKEKVETPVEDVKVEATTTVAEQECSKAECASTEAVAAPVQTAVATRTPQDNAFDDENIGFEDIRLPRLNIVQKVGDLSTIFTPGEIVLNQNLVIHSPGKDGKGDSPINFTVLGFKKKQFVEKVEGGALGAIYNNEEALVENGGTLDYKEWQESLKSAKETGGKALKYFQRLATALILIEKPETVEDPDNTIFPYDCEGKWYSLALWSMKGTAYTNAAKFIFTARKIGHLRTTRNPDGSVKSGGYTSGAWSLTTKLEKFSSNYAFIPVLRSSARNSEGFVAFSHDILGAGN